MDEPIDRILVRGGRHFCQPQTLHEYQALSRRCLEALQDAHPLFRRVTTVGAVGVKPIEQDLGNLEAVIAAQCYDRTQQADYSNTRTDGTLGPESLSHMGFSLSYCSRRDDDPRALLPIEQGGVDFILRGSSTQAESSSDVVMRLPTDALGDIHSPTTLRSLLKIAVEVWGCKCVGITPYRYGQMVKDGEVASYAGEWLFFLPFPDLGRCLPQGVRHEKFSNGILIETTPHVPNASNAADIAAGRKVRDALNDLGLIWYSTYAIEGWPPDREEWHYEEFITGATSGLKYVVHCVTFDGYDAERNVLLYAKLFRYLRQQPREWGLRGWDGPVLNEAKRQVRAAAKGGGLQIEWHIGLAEPAQRVRQLLADYTDITEQQLKVIHTPLEEALQAKPLA